MPTAPPRHLWRSPYLLAGLRGGKGKMKEGRGREKCEGYGIGGVGKCDVEGMIGGKKEQKGRS